MSERGTNEIIDDAVSEWLCFSADPRVNCHGIYKALEDLLRHVVEGEWGYSALETYAAMEKFNED